ncbi:MAG: TSUP family transporter [Firmicutes bacterium]|nr:TSUP family transporter [Bacillota bacterium]
MLDTLPVALIAGTVLGFLAGLGIGGGSLLILWLTMVLHMDAMAARSINLLFFIPSAAVVCVLRLRQGNLKIRPLLPAALAGCAAAALFSWISTAVDTQILKKLFGLVLLFAGLRELCYRPRNAR